MAETARYRAGRVPLVAVGVWRPGSGFTRVLQAILARLTGAYAVHFVGIGFQGPPRDVDGITLHPCNPDGTDVFGAYRAAALTEELDARVVLLLHDLWILYSHLRTLPRVQDRAAVVAYVPLDGELTDDRLLEPLALVDRFVAYTHFGQRQLERALRRLAARGLPVASTDVAIIPHGVDTDTFYPLAGTVAAQLDRARRQARHQLFPGEPDWHDAFVVLNANRPLERKRIDLTIEGFARFAADKPSGVKLWLHHAIMDASERAEVLTLAARHGIADRLCLTPLGAPPLTDAQLNLVYNAADVGLNTSMGEGWGLVSFEHAATGAAQVVPRHSACAELWDGAAELLDTTEPAEPLSSTPLAMRVVSPAGVAAALERLYADPAHLRALSLAAYRNATQPPYRWDAIAARWDALFQELLATRRGCAPRSLAADPSWERRHPWRPPAPVGALLAAPVRPPTPNTFGAHSPTPGRGPGRMNRR